MNELFHLSVAEASSLIRQRKLSPVELVQAHLDRIAAFESHLRSFITLTEEIALREAKRATEEIAGNRVVGPLHGIPITYKDLLATAGVRTTAASRVYADWVPDKDANVVNRLKKAGSVMLGKVNLPEFAFSGGVTEQDFIKPARNPWNAAFETGGSSSGSAVGVASGLAMASVGSDSGGSIRIPAAHCGVVGLKPTYGLVGRGGEIALAYSVGHVGPITRTVEDAAIMLESMAGYDLEDRASIHKDVPPYSKLLSEKKTNLRLGICPSYMEAVGGEIDVTSAFRSALEVFRSLGFKIQEVAIPHIDYACLASYNNILRIEGFCSHFQNFRDPAIRSRYGRAYRNIVRGGFLSTVDYLRAQQARTLITAKLAETFKSIDVLLTPTTPESPSHLGSATGLPEQT
ncbi:MAG TPA: amidase, partial [Terriglobales bacterium]|nr:amidase [Terriglobales bacterium]